MNREKPRLLRILEQLPLPPDSQYVISGSAVLVLHGIERAKPMGDLDIFVATRVWFEILGSWDGWSVFTTDPSDEHRRNDPPYLYKVIDGLEVNLFSAWRKREVGNIDAAERIRLAEFVDGYPCTQLEYMLEWKEEVGRAKDRDDIRIIRAHLGMES